MKDLAFFRDKMIELHQRQELSGEELTDLGTFVNTIVVHITDGNEIEKEATGIMGGTAYETESERLKREEREKVQGELDQARQEAEEAKKKAEESEKIAEESKKIAEESEKKAEYYLTILREHGIDPNQN